MKQVFILLYLLPVIVSAQSSSRMTRQTYYQYDTAIAAYRLSAMTHYYFHNGHGGDRWKFLPHKYDSAISVSFSQTGSMQEEYKIRQLVSGDNIVRESYTWNKQAAGWVPADVYDIQYHNNGKPLVSFYKRWKDGTWQNYSLQKNVYNGSDNPLSETVLSRDSSAVWDSVYRRRWVYSGKRIDTLVTQYYINGWRDTAMTVGYHNGPNSTYLSLKKQGNAWDNTQQVFAVYDADDKKLADSVEVWHVPSQKWKPDSRTYYTYDATGNITDYIHQRVVWLAFSNYTFANDFKQELTYNAFGQRTGIVSFEWNELDNRWDSVGTEIYTYESYFPTGISSSPAHTAPVIYPNPSGDYIMLHGIDHISYAILDRSGRVVQSGIVSGRIDISSLPAGSYFVNMGAQGAAGFVKQ